MSRLGVVRQSFVRIRFDLPLGVALHQNGTLLTGHVDENSVMEMAALLRGLAKELEKAIGEDE